MEPQAQVLISFLFAAIVAAVGLAIWGFSERRRRIELEAGLASPTQSSSFNADRGSFSAESGWYIYLLRDYRRFVNEFHAEHVPEKNIQYLGEDNRDPDALVRDAISGLSVIDGARHDADLIRLVNNLRGKPKKK